MLAEAAAAGARVVTTYGMTETCGGCVYDGLPLDGVQVAAGPDGRIRISGPVLFSGYRLAPELTAAALRGLVRHVRPRRLGADGRLMVRGRADDVINSGGEKIVAAEVEQALRGCPRCARRSWWGRPTRTGASGSRRWSSRPIRPRRPAWADLRAHVRASLPRYAAPQALLLVAEIPMLPSGKPDRQRLRHGCQAGRVDPPRP